MSVEIPEYLLKKLRQRLSLDENDTKKDEYIKNRPPFTNLRELCGWQLGDSSWADEFKMFCEGVGIKLDLGE